MLEFSAPHNKCTAFKYNNGNIGFGMLLKLASMHVDSGNRTDPSSNSLTALVFACDFISIWQQANRLFLPVCISQL